MKTVNHIVELLELLSPAQLHTVLHEVKSQIAKRGSTAEVSAGGPGHSHNLMPSIWADDSPF